MCEARFMLPALAHPIRFGTMELVKSVILLVQMFGAFSFQHTTYPVPKVRMHLKHLHIRKSIIQLPTWSFKNWSKEEEPYLTIILRELHLPIPKRSIAPKLQAATDWHCKRHRIPWGYYIFGFGSHTIVSLIYPTQQEVLRLCIGGNKICLDARALALIN